MSASAAAGLINPDPLPKVLPVSYASLLTAMPFTVYVGMGITEDSVAKTLTVDFHNDNVLIAGETGAGKSSLMTHFFNASVHGVTTTFYTHDLNAFRGIPANSSLVIQTDIIEFQRDMLILAQAMISGEQVEPQLILIDEFYAIDDVNFETVLALGPSRGISVVMCNQRANPTYLRHFNHRFVMGQSSPAANLTLIGEHQAVANVQGRFVYRAPNGHLTVGQAACLARNTVDL